jgi:hypothetical protein
MERDAGLPNWMDGIERHELEMVVLWTDLDKQHERAYQMRVAQMSEMAFGLLKMFTKR